jgi:hypothetical protein
MDYFVQIPLQNVEHFQNMAIWCQQNIGNYKEKWSAVNYQTLTATFMFIREEDSQLFKEAWIG